MIDCDLDLEDFKTNIKSAQTGTSFMFDASAQLQKVFKQILTHPAYVFDPGHKVCQEICQEMTLQVMETLHI